MTFLANRQQFWPILDEIAIQYVEKFRHIACEGGRLGLSIELGSGWVISAGKGAALGPHVVCHR